MEYLILLMMSLAVAFGIHGAVENAILRRKNADLKREIIAYQASLTNAVNGINHGHK
jgi:hypothetical protein